MFGQVICFCVIGISICLGLFWVEDFIRYVGVVYWYVQAKDFVGVVIYVIQFVVQGCCDYCMGVFEVYVVISIVSVVCLFGIYQLDIDVVGLYFFIQYFSVFCWVQWYKGCIKIS